ncbi:DUF2332 domain-containing protein [Actinoallomurus soli]|uniref:DUF2332 domain-containing protein n=1 Tax=Actinoallomurus soli TaxID=2952535 RepID=UPI0020935869|nr:DUF2332 domain-containing protein [Actinoallomurus soli]MCO5971320.1 DUF2332 domain-containing protein [Actinoallomurus soli]
MEAEHLRRLFGVFSAAHGQGRSLVYEALSKAVTSNDELLALLMRTPRDQRRPSLLFAAVNSVLAAHPDAALASYYPIHGGRRPVDDQLITTFAAFCAEHGDELDHLLRTGSTQTNEIRRCAALRLALGHVSERWGEPVVLAEVGASAGLNLLLDRYRYRIGGREMTPATDSPVVISCELRGATSADPLRRPLPEITSRLGIDMRPVSLADPVDRAWLEAFIWPEDVDGLATLRGAMELAVAIGVPPVVRGDAAADTARLLADLPGSEPIVVFTASLLSYLGVRSRAAFLSRLDELAQRRPVAWAFAEAPGLVAATNVAVPALQGPLAKRNTLYLVGVSLRDHGRQDDSLLALADPYLRWLAPARQPADDFGWLPAEPNAG